MKVEWWEFSFRKGLERRCLYKDVDKKRKQTVNDTHHNDCAAFFMVSVVWV